MRINVRFSYKYGVQEAGGKKKESKQVHMTPGPWLCSPQKVRMGIILPDLLIHKSEALAPLHFPVLFLMLSQTSVFSQLSLLQFC